MKEGLTKPVGAALSAIKILKYLSVSRTPKRLVEISADLGINNSTCLNILRTMESEEFISRVDSKLYEIGPALMDIGQRIAKTGRIVPILEQITSRYGINALFWRRFGQEQLVLTACSNPESIVNIDATIGMRVPLLTGSMGRVIAGSGEFSRAELAEMFEKTVWQRPLDFETFLTQAGEAADRGWSEERGYYLEGVTAICVPIPGESRKITRLLTAFGLSDLIPDDVFPALARDMLKAAELIALEE